MYRNQSSSFFLGTSSPQGFYSLFSELYSPEDNWKLYILKGGPGTGKSTFLKKIAAEAAKKGLYHERIYCSSDPKSLDAVIIPSKKISIADGTAPHVLEPAYPGVCEFYVDLGQFRNNAMLIKNKDEIIELTNQNRLQHKKCIDFLSAAKAVDNDTGALILSYLRIERLHKFAEKLALAKLKSASNQTGKTKKRFLSALTSSGFVLFSDTFEDLCEDIYVLEDNFGHAATIILKVLYLKAKEQGFDTILCTCPMSPDYRAEHLIIPELSLGFFTSNKYHPNKFKKFKLIDCKRFFDYESMLKHKNAIAFNNRSRDELISEALKKLEKAKYIHDALEKFYTDAMNFDALNEYEEELITKIFA